MAYELAKALVRVGTDLGPLKTGLGGAKSMIFGAVGRLTTTANRLASVAGAGLLGFGVAAVKFGSDAQEMGNMFDTVFKDQAAGADKFSREFALKIGRSIGDVKREMANFQDTFVPLGFARDEAAGMSKQLTKLTADLASFKNKSDSAVSNALTSALVGNHDAVRSLGVVITEATLKQELMRMGAAKLTGQALETAKVQARLNLIMKSTKDAQGDAERTSGSFQNRMKGLSGAIKDVTADIGQGLLPVLASLAGEATRVIRSVQPMIKMFTTEFGDVTRVLASDWAATWEIMVQSTTVQLTRLVGIVQGEIEFIKSHMARMGEVVKTGLSFMFDQAKQMVADFAVNVSTAFAQMAENISAALQGRVAKTLDNSGLRTAIEKALGLDEPLKFKMPKDAMPFADIFKETEATRREMEKLEEMTDKLFKKQNKQRERAGNEEANDRLRKSRDLRDMKTPSGSLGFKQLNAAFQQAAIDRASGGGNHQQVTLLQHANEIAQRMDQKLEGIKVALQKTPDRRPVA